MIPTERWFWCSVCDTAAVVCRHCATSSCLGGGCKRCATHMEAAFAEVVAGRAPDPGALPRLEALWADPLSLLHGERGGEDSPLADPRPLTAAAG